jgi:hypothetical protein
LLRSLTLALLLALLPAAPLQALQGPSLEPGVAVCVLAPRVEPVQDADGAGVVPVPRPSLLVIEPLQEVRIERAGQPRWIRRALRGSALPMPLAWTAPPIRSGEIVLVRLQPLQAPPEAFAHVLLVGDSPRRMAETAGLISSLGGSGPDWLAAIEAALLAGDVALAWALLFAPEAPAAPDLQALRLEVVRRGCGD